MSSSPKDLIHDRKKDHVTLTADGSSAYQKANGLERFEFIHNALPEIHLNDVSTETEFLGRTFSFPLFISSMTGGYAGATAVNESIARFCERNSLPFGVGSQRAMLVSKEMTSSFSVVRKYAPTSFIASNIGGCQLLEETWKEDVTAIMEAIDADALIIHLNPLQELMQPEGDRNFKGIKDRIGEVVQLLSKPVIVKETGAGISGYVAQQLLYLGVQVIDCAGAGGTSWAKVENQRHQEAHLQIFNEWGMSLADCLIAYQGLPKHQIEIIASGGIRSAFDIVKSLALGANITASAQPVINALMNSGEEGLEEWFQGLKTQVQITLCLLGVAQISQLGKHHLKLR